MAKDYEDYPANVGLCSALWTFRAAYGFYPRLIFVPMKYNLTERDSSELKDVNTSLRISQKPGSQNLIFAGPRREENE